jgi:hypothetical protein
MPVPASVVKRTVAILWFLSVACMYTLPARSQALTDPVTDRRVESVSVTITNPSSDQALNERIEDFVRRSLGLYPSDRYSAEAARFALARARRSPDIADVSQTIEAGPTGGVVVNVTVTLGKTAEGADVPRGMIQTGRAADFPVLYDHNGTYLRAKLEALSMYYGNQDAWYGQPDVLLQGNPLVAGTPAGKGYQDWIEGFVHAGLYGITPLTKTLYIYGGVSGIQSGSVGDELFTDETRTHFGVEDAYMGIVGGTRGEKGGRLVFDLSAGRQRFSIGEGFLIVNSAANGGERAALQSNPRWASDLLVIGSIKLNNLKLQAFRFDPDELPIIDTRTVINGVNVEWRNNQGLDVGATWLTVPRSDFGYFTTTRSFTREGLKVYDARVRWQPAPADRTGPFLAAEAALQRHDEIAMRANGAYGEAGWIFSDVPWTPTISYRYARFTGDDPATSRFERWDPLFSGGTGEQWVQGINHFKIFQDSNLIAHRLQGRLRPSPKIEIVPQAWLFEAQSKTNLGGNPALSFLDSKSLGHEFNVTGKYYASRRVLVQGSVAATFAGRAVEDAIDGRTRNWLSTMMFVRIGF